MSGTPRTGDWMQTYTGRKFWPLDPAPEDVHIEDIAHALSLLCRFGGHCREFYSVAQHSVFVSSLARESERFAALLHDGAEAYLGDVIRPLKKHLAGIKEIEQKLEGVIFQCFGIGGFDKDEIVRADAIALYTEMRDIMHEPPEAWEGMGIYLPLTPPEKIVPLSSRESETLFLARFHELTSREILV